MKRASLRRFGVVVALVSALVGGRASAQDLQVHLAFEGDVEDASGNGRDGALTIGGLGNASYAPGPVGDALELDHDEATRSSDQIDGAYVSIPYRLTEAGSIVFWYRVSPYYNYQNIWDNSGQQDDFEMWVYNDGRLRARVDGNVGQVTHQLEGFHRWYHIAYTWERGGLARLWVDGIERDTGSAIRNIANEAFDAALLGDIVYLGGGNDGNTYAIGAYDDFRIYDGALDEAAIQALMDLGDPPEIEPGDPPELLLQWDFDGDDRDASGNGYDAEITVGALGDTAYVEGPLGQALELSHDPDSLTTDLVDGAYVSVPLELPEDGTIALWYRVTDFYDYQTIFDNSGAASDYEMWIYGSGVVRGRLTADVGQASHQLEGINKWYHIVYSWRRGDQARLWVDGVQRDLNSGLRGISEQGFEAAIVGDTFYLGGGNEGNTFANGAYDDVRIYSGVLDDAAVQALFEAGDPPIIDPGGGDDPELQIAWDFEDDVDDSSGNGRDGDLIIGALGDVSFIEGPVGKAIDFDHDFATLTSDQIEGAYIAVDYRLTEAGTILFWYKTEPYYNYQSLWDNSADPNDFEMWIYDTGVLRGRIDGGVGQVSHQLGEPRVWYHIAYTWQKGDKARLWVDGQETDLGSPERTIADSQFDAALLGDTFYLGGGSPGNTFGIGAFDDFRIYDGALDEATIQAIFAEGDPPEDPGVEPEDPGPVALHWPLDGDLVNVGDLGSDYDGVLVEGAVATPEYVPGVVGQGLSLDHGDGGTPLTGGSYVQVQNPLVEEGTIALWYYARDYYNYQTIWDNSVFENDWEMWIYNDGRVRARVGQTPASGVVTFDLDNLDGPNQWYHIAFTWSRDEAVTNLFVNGKLVSSGSIVNWVDPGDTFYLAGGNDGNNYGNGVWDDVRIYDFVLSEAEVLYVMQGETSCPEEGDTHCEELIVEGPAGNTAGSYQATCFASDDSGDAVIYTFTASNGVDPDQVFGPQSENVASFDLTVGTWDLSVSVDDQVQCDDVAADATCAQNVVVVEGGGDVVFRRGDVDDSGGGNITDAIAVLNHLFAGADRPACWAAADANGDGSVNVSDPVYHLNFLFGGGDPPPAPGPDTCGPASAADEALGCDQYTSC